MPREISKLLQEIVQSAKAIQAYVTNKNLVNYLADPILQDAVERRLFIVGEALVQLSQIDQTLTERFEDWRQIRAFRNLLAHGYFAVDPERVWTIVQDELATTLQTAMALMEELD